MSSAYTSQAVSITLPRRRDTDSLARLATTAVAFQAGLNLDQTDDLNTAVDEIVRVLARDNTSSGTFTIRYIIHADRLEIVAGAFSRPVIDSSESGHYRHFILENITDSFEEQKMSDGSFNLRLVKLI